MADADKEYREKKRSKPEPISKELNHQVTEEQKRVNLSWIREKFGRFR